MAETYTGEVKNGVVVIDEGTPLPEGARLRIELIAEPEARPPQRSLTARLASVIGRAEGLPTDLADQHDHYLHGQPKR
jgi:hypothetical protein